MTGSIEKLKKAYDIQVKWRAFPLNPGLPPEGITLDDLFKKKGYPIRADKAVAELQATAARFGLPMGNRKMVYDSRPAQELGLWAESRGRGHAFHNEAFNAYFVRGENIAMAPVLLDMATAVGLDRDEAGNALEKRPFRDAVDKDWELSRAKGVQAAPTFFMGLDRLVGAQSYQILERMVAKYAAPAEPEKSAREQA
ncbi:MAG: DsbA family protein [Desulfobacter sp.]|nr:MAG: DsbA family protein [Desulfobacter sp.]